MRWGELPNDERPGYRAVLERIFRLADERKPRRPRACLLRDVCGLTRWAQSSSSFEPLSGRRELFNDPQPALTAFRARITGKRRIGNVNG
jgi:hypothetical protein